VIADATIPSSPEMRIFSQLEDRDLGVLAALPLCLDVDLS
jgi:hypothetical protein